MKKNILVGISGGIAVYKVAQLVSNLSKVHEVQVVMTEHALEFMTPLSFETLTHREVFYKMFGEGIHHMEVPHIDLAKWADIIILAPTTANLIAKMANGISDDLMSAMLLAARCPILLCPAMNTFMLNHPATQENLKTLESRGVIVLESEAGMLACGDYGSGKLPAPEVIQAKAEEILNSSTTTGKNSINAENLQTTDDLTGLHVTVTAGPTQEALDPVRFISNHSSGKMGYAIARAAMNRGAKVTLISGPVQLTAPEGVELVAVKSAMDMFEAVKNQLDKSDILVKAAAVSDYRASEIQEEKIKKSGDELVLRMVKNPDILAWAGENKPEGTVLCGFAMETENLLANAKAKLEKKNCDLLVANNLKVEGAGFATDTNVATLIWRDKQEALSIMSKDDLADRILDECLILKGEK